MSQNRENIFNQINRKNAIDDILNGDLNPVLSTPSNILANLQTSTPNDSVKRTYNWAYRSFGYQRGNGLFPLNDDILNYANDRILFEEYPSDNGNLTLLVTEKNVVHKFSAFVYKNTFGTTKIIPNWSGAFAVYLNSGVIAKTDYQGFQSQELTIGFNSGWNILDIYLYTKSDGPPFSLNSEIGAFADDWSTPSLEEPITPTNFSVILDSGSFGTRNPHTMILRWDPTDPSTTMGYNIYRQGPYNTGITTPGFTGASSSGYFVSGIAGVSLRGVRREAFYSISATTSNGETLPSEPIRIDFTPMFSGVSFTSGLSSGSSNDVTSGILAQGLYSYYIASRNPIGYKFPQNSPLTVFNTGNCIWLSWSGVSNVDTYEIYRFSGVVSNTGHFIASLGSATLRYLDTGLMPSFITGIVETQHDYDNLALNTTYPATYKNNCSYLGWAAPSATDTGVITYKLYRTFYSGLYDKDSYLGGTTNLFFIDSGIYGGQTKPFTGKPTVLENIATLNYGTNKYKDVGLIANKSYNYKISSHNYSLVESPFSTGYTVKAGDPFAPATPTGINIVSFNGFATIGWQNGLEDDLEGTKIYKSEVLNGPYNLLTETIGTTYTTFVGYSGSPYFKLSNFDTSSNESPLSAAYQGSGTMTVDNIIVKNIKLLSTTDVDLDYFIPSGYQPSAIHFPSGFYPHTSRVFSDTLGSFFTNFYGAFCDINDLTRRTVLFGPSNKRWTRLDLTNRERGIYSLSTTDDRFSLPTPWIHAIYYSGTSLSDANVWLNTYKPNANANATLWTKSILASGIGDIFNTNLTDGEYPVVTNTDGYINENVVIFVSGSVNNYSFGFRSFSDSGLVNGNTFYYKDLDISSLANGAGDLDAVKDKDNNIHIIFPNTSGLAWYKFSYLTGVPGSLTLLQKNPKLFSTKGSSRIFLDNDNGINIIMSIQPDLEKSEYLAKIDISGNILYQPNEFTSTNFRYNDFSLAYHSGLNIGYIGYSFPSGYDKVGDDYLNAKYLVYNYSPGGYRRRLIYDNINNSSLYQILQTIIK